MPGTKAPGAVGRRPPSTFRLSPAFSNDPVALTHMIGQERCDLTRDDDASS